MSIEAFEATDRAFDSRIHALKNHPGQAHVASGLRRMLEASEIVASHRDCDRVQDPYSFRCVPQVLGAVLDALYWVEDWVTREINSVTDNPLVFVEDEEIVSGGNFHGEHMAIALDALGIAVSEIGTIAERRIDKLLDNDSDTLPQFLVAEPGLNSGLMVTQYLAAALVSENKIHAHPAAVDSIPTSAGFEDHVSMGSISALKLSRIVDNVARIVAVELLNGAQAMEFFKPMRGGAGSQAAFDCVRRHVPFVERDSVVSGYLATLESMVRSGELVSEVERAVGTLLPDRGSGDS
jgi:histidine ammonia-lyase